MASPDPAGAKPTALDPPGLYDPAPSGDGRVVVAEGGARVACIAGRGGEERSGALSPDFAVQVAQAFANLEIALEAAAGICACCNFAANGRSRRSIGSWQETRIRA